MSVVAPPQNYLQRRATVVDPKKEVLKEAIWKMIRKKFFEAQAVDQNTEDLKRDVKKSLYSLQADCLIETEETKRTLERLRNDLDRIEYR